MPKYYDPETKTLKETDKPLNPRDLHLISANVAGIVPIPSGKAVNNNRQYIWGNMPGPGLLWTKPTYVSVADGNIYKGHFNMDHPSNKDLRLVEKLQLLDADHDLTAGAEEEKAAPARP